MKTQSCKSKGRRLQQLVARSILEAFPELGDGDAVSTSMGAGGEDVRMSPAARARVPLSIECKNVEKINVWGCLEQATANAPAGASPCLVFTRNRAPVWAAVHWNVLLELLRRVHAGGSTTTSPRVRELVAELARLVDADADAMDADAMDANAEDLSSAAVDCA